MGPYLGDFLPGALVRGKWDTANAAGASITRATNGTISVYKDGSTTQSVAGVTDTEDFDSLVGIHDLVVDTAADASFYAQGEFQIVLSGATIDGQTVNAVLFSFSILRNANMLGIIDAGIAQAIPANNQIQFRAGLSLADDLIIGATVLITEATTGAKQTGIIADYNNGTDTATLLADWTINPTGTIRYVIFATAAAPDINAIKAVTDKLNTALELDGGVYRFTSNALETAPTASDAGIFSGTADSGTTTTMVDAALTQADIDHWAGNLIEWTSGPIAGQVRLITAFDPANDRITFHPAVTQAVTTNTYKIHKGARALLAGITHTGAVIPTVTDLTNKAALFQAAVPEAYPADNADASVIELLWFMKQLVSQFSISGTTYTARRKDKTTIAFTLTLNDATSPTALSRTT